MGSRQPAFASPDRAYEDNIDSDGSVGKDEDEAKLERLLFGDVGFQDALKGHEIDSGSLLPKRGSDSESMDEDEEDEDGALVDVDDTDVSVLCAPSCI